MMDIKDEDILEVFKLEDKNSSDKVFHGVLRQGGKIVVVYERNSGGYYSGFQEKSVFDPSKLSEVQIKFLKGRGYNFN